MVIMVVAVQMNGCQPKEKANAIDPPQGQRECCPWGWFEDVG